MTEQPETGETHQRFASSSTSDPAATRAFAIEAARLASDDKCEDVVVLDVRKLSQVSDYLVVCSGTSDRQMRSVAQDVEELGVKRGFPLFRRDIDDRTTWVVVDCVDVVVHVFEPNMRAHYDLEMLWADAPRVEWERGKEPKAPAATSGEKAGAEAPKPKPKRAKAAAAKPAKKATSRKKTSRKSDE